jgi:uncharacterized protein YcbK (DUF882 family)
MDRQKLPRKKTTNPQMTLKSLQPQQACPKQSTANRYRRRKEEEEEEAQKEEDGSRRGINQTDFSTTNRTLKTLSLRTIPHRRDPRIYRQVRPLKCFLLMVVISGE